MTPFLVILVLIKIDYQESLCDDVHKLIFVPLNVSLVGRWILSSLHLFFGKCCPEFVCLSSNSVALATCCQSRDLLNLGKVKFQMVILLNTDLSKCMQSVFLNFLILQLTSCEYFVHQEVSICIITENVLGISN